ncbi:PrpR N-terminal domain-containing protein [Paenibacillus sp. RC67]|uniref:sigma-54-dependent Fis family transcriptional regulator n=1 Tax=Paenibacillus sp. RC67 TaxID=3039392 RepID=UPI0024AD0108|nr:PrpR N-terminal domain-containing protein [Paenibacillus sp. RC67]
MQTKIRILAIAPYPGLKDVLLEAAGQVESIQMDVEVADLQEAIPLVQHAEERGYNMIVSRGGTATVIREHVKIPVIDIPVSGYDILRVLTLVKNTNATVAIIGFPSICRGVAEVSSLLQIDIPSYEVQHEAEVAVALQQAFQSGVQIVLGDMVTIRTAQDMGYRGILITSGRESAEDMLGEVLRVYEVYRNGQEKVHFYRRLLDADKRGIIVLDELRRVEYVNQAACRMLRQSEEGLQGQNVVLASPALANVIKQTDESRYISDGEHYVHLFDEQYKVNVMLHETAAGHPGFLVYLESLTAWRSERRFEAYIPSRLVTFTQLAGTSPTLQKTVNRAKKFAGSTSNLWISGERGSGKFMFAQAIHSASRREQEGFYMIACDEVLDEEMNRLVHGSVGVSGLLEGGYSGTLYLNRADRLSPEAQESVLQLIRNNRNFRFIASSSIPMTKLAKRGDYNQELIYAIGELHLTVPPLREHVEDAEEMIRVMIAEYNSQSGKQIVGMRETVLERLTQYDWPGNIPEFESTIREMLLMTKGNYTEWEEVDQVWERLLQHSGSRSSQETYIQIDLSGTYEEIEERILRQVLQEEGMNQSKTCKRLGINRATLWRKMNKMFKNKT